MYDCATTHINGYVAGITDNITRLSFGIGYPYTTASHRTGGMWQADTKVCIDGFDKSGTVCTVCQTLTTPYIRVADKLCGIRHNRASLSTVACPGRSTGTAAGRRTTGGRTTGRRSTGTAATGCTVIFAGCRLLLLCSFSCCLFLCFSALFSFFSCFTCSLLCSLFLLDLTDLCRLLTDQGRIFIGLFLSGTDFGSVICAGLLFLFESGIKLLFLILALLFHRNKLSLFVLQITLEGLYILYRSYICLECLAVIVVKLLCVLCFI